MAPRSESILGRIEQHHAACQDKGRDGHVPNLIVIHVAGSDDGGPGGRRAVDSWFANPASQASAHFCVDNQGGISQYVDTDDFAWGNGIWEGGWDTGNPILADAHARGINPNSLSISIENAGQPGAATTAYNTVKGYTSLVKLVQYLAERYRIPMDRTHVIGHYQISAQSRHNCPGQTFPWAKFLADLNRATTSVVKDDGTTATIKTPWGNVEVTQAFREWYLQGPVYWGLPRGPMAYDAYGSVSQTFEHHVMKWSEAHGLEVI